MAFMNTYFKKKNNVSPWNNNLKKRKFDDVDRAVKKLKLVLLEPECNGPKRGAIKDRSNEIAKLNFPSLQMRSVSFMSKSLAACLCQCSEDGISIFLEESVSSDSCITLKFSDVESIPKKVKHDRLFIHVAREKVESLKRTFQVETWHHGNFTDGDGQKLHLNFSECEKSKAIEDFCQHIKKYLKQAPPSGSSRKEVELLHKSQEINVRSFYGSMKKVMTEVEDCLVDETEGNDGKVNHDDTGLTGILEAKASREVIECVTSVDDDDDDVDYVKEEAEKPVEMKEEEEEEEEMDIFEAESPRIKTRSSRKPKDKQKRAKCAGCGEEFDDSSSSRRSRCSDCSRGKASKTSRAKEVNISHTEEPVRLFEYPSPPAVGRITFTSHDLACLEPEEFFNDVNIDFYLKFFHQEVLSQEDKSRTHIFSSFFYSHLTSAKDYHWFLAIICYPGLCEKLSEVRKSDPVSEKKVKAISKNKASRGRSDALDLIAGYGNSSSEEDEVKAGRDIGSEDSSGVVKSPLILIFDSLAGGKPRWDITKVLRQYLQMEWNEKKQSTKGEKIFDVKVMKGCVPRCPQQSNHYDCGPYLLLCVQHFFMSPIKNFVPPIKKLMRWFTGNEADRFRVELKSLVKTLSGKDASSSRNDEASFSQLEIL